MHPKQQSLNFKRILNPGRTTGSTVVINTLQKTYHFLVKYVSSMKANAEQDLKAKIPWTGSKNANKQIVNLCTQQ